MIVSVIKNKIKALFSPKISFSAVIGNSKIDSMSVLRQNVRLYDSQVGGYTIIGRNCLIQNTEIGRFCTISESCHIGLPSHPLDFVSTSPVFLEGDNYLRHNFSKIKYEDCPKTIIGNDIWLGLGVKIKSGLHIGDGAVIAAGAVVTHDVPPYAVVGGVPAKIIKYRFDDDTIAKLKEIDWFNWEQDKIRKYANAFESPKELFGRIK